MTKYEDEYIKGALAERKRIKKEIMRLTMATSGTVFYADVIDVIEGRTANASDKR